MDQQFRHVVSQDAEYFENKRSKARGKPDRSQVKLELDDMDIRGDREQQLPPHDANEMADRSQMPSHKSATLHPPQPTATMMSREARDLVNSEDGVKAWKVM